MKRAMFIALILSSALAIFFQRYAFSDPSGKCDKNHDQGFTCPILIGGDDTANSARTTATNVKLLSHPQVQAGNFMPIYQVGAADIVATPGAKFDDKYNNDMLVQIPGRGGSDWLNGIGPDDFEIDNANSEFSAKIDLRSENNFVGRRLTIADIRKEVSGNEFNILFGEDPLEAGLIGHGGYIKPYTKELYPSAIANEDKKFQFCMPSGGMPFYTECSDERPPLGSPFDDIFPYDVAVDDNIIITAAYDPVLLKIKAEGGIFVNGSGNFIQDTKTLLEPYISPLIFYKKIDDRYRLLGYTGLKWPRIEVEGANIDNYFELDSLLSYNKENNNEPVIENIDEVLKFVYTNPWIPFASNPIAIEVMKKADGKPMYPVVYQNTLFNLDNYILNPYGRPYTFPKVEILASGIPASTPEYFTYRELLGRMVGWGQFISLKDEDQNLFPSGVVSPVIFWSQNKEFNDDSYEQTNPSHVFDPSPMVLVSPGQADAPGIYDAAAGVDFKGTVNERDMLFVPSSIQLGFSLGWKPGDKYSWMGPRGYIYEIDITDESRQLWMKSWKPKYYENYSIWGYEEIYNKMPIFIPRKAIIVDHPKGNFVPYQIKAANLDGDECVDLLLTWRGGMLKPIQGDSVKFDDGNGKMFANYFTIAYRKKGDGNICEVPPDGTKYFPLTPQDAMVSSIATGDFDKNGSIDIVAGNLKLETAPDGKFTSYAYLFSSSSKDVNGYPMFNSVDAKRIRVGFDEFDELGNNTFGSGNIETDGNTIVSINGLPLMLPTIGCPDGDSLSVGSLFETLSSALYMEKSYGVYYIEGLPFVSENKPIPFRCISQPATCDVVDKMVTKLPLWSDDCPIKTGTDAFNNAYLQLCIDKNTPKPYVGFVDCNMLYLQSGSWPDDEWETCGNQKIDGVEQCENGQYSILYSQYIEPEECPVCYKGCVCHLCGNGIVEIGENCEVVELKETVGDKVKTSYKVYLAEGYTTTENCVACNKDTCSCVPPTQSPECGNGKLEAILDQQKDCTSIDQKDCVLYNEECEIDKDGKIIKSSPLPGEEEKPCTKCKGCECISEGAQSKRDHGNDSDTNGQTEFAGTRPDIVYSSGRHAIVNFEDTLPAGGVTPTVGQPEQNYPSTLADHWLVQISIMAELEKKKKDEEKIPKDNVPPGCTLIEDKESGNQSLLGISLILGTPTPVADNLKDVKLPHGREMFGIREMTAVIPYSPNAPLCQNKQLDKGEECDGTLIAPGHEGCICTPGCRCEYPPPETCPNGQLDLDKGEECDGDLIAPGKEGCICNPGCKCEYPPPALIGEIKPGGESIEVEKQPTTPAELQAWVPTPILSDCCVNCDDFSTNEYKEVFEKLNEENYRGPTGRTDDSFCEMGQKVKVVCYVRNAFKAVTVGGETIWKANPYIMTQDEGFQLDPQERESKIQNFNLINTPVILFPHEPVAGEGKAMATFTLPDLSMAQDAQIIYGGVTPNAMPAETVIHGADGSTTIINNMIKHTMDRILPENFQDMFKGQEVAAGDSGMSDGQHTTEFILQPFAIFGITLESGQQQIKNLEEQGLSYEDLLIENQPTPGDVRAFFEANKMGGATPPSGITYDAPWAKQSHYKFSLITEQGGKGDAKAAFMSDESAAGSATASSLAISQFSVFATDPTVARGGSYASAIGSCVKCTMYDDDIDLRAILAMMAFVLISSGGVAAVRVVVHIRRRKR